MSDAELSRDLALALGYYPESVRVMFDRVCHVWRIKHGTPGWESTEWMDFDYRDPSVVVPLIKWFLSMGIFFTRDSIFTDRIMARGCPSEMDRSYSTLEECVARAVIAVRKG